MKPTEQQTEIIEYPGNAVIIAAPGSGKTYVVSEKIRGYFPNLLDHEGVIAISYTNKASNELRERCLRNGINSKSSFFGTIDKFYISEIIIPFGKHLFGIPKRDIRVVKTDTLEEEEQTALTWLDRNTTLTKLKRGNISLLESYFSKGILLIESIGVLATYIFKNSLACRKYITARYKYIFIDEYQDSGVNQHELFLDIVALGIVGVAVGDLNQSIFGFSGKDSRFLASLKEDNAFEPFFLLQNHRCHPSIVNYSSYFLDHTVPLLESDSDRVYLIKVEGGTNSLASWIDKNVAKIKRQFNINNNSQVGILTKSNKLSKDINGALQTPSKLSITTDLDVSLNIWSSIFANLLRFIHDEDYKFIEVVETFSSFDKISKSNVKNLLMLKQEIVSMFEEEWEVDDVIEKFSAIAEIIAPNSHNEESIEILQGVLETTELLDSYRPADEEELNIMTIHKSKGLEFDAVIHLELYEWVLPQKGPGPNKDFKNPVYDNLVQDKNLHYVAVTRAKQACILLVGTQRTNYYGEIKNASDSEFLHDNNIADLRFKRQKQ